MTLAYENNDMLSEQGIIERQESHFPHAGAGESCGVGWKALFYLQSDDRLEV